MILAETQLINQDVALDTEGYTIRIWYLNDPNMESSQDEFVLGATRPMQLVYDLMNAYVFLNTPFIDERFHNDIREFLMMNYPQIKRAYKINNCEDNYFVFTVEEIQ